MAKTSETRDTLVSNSCVAKCMHGRAANAYCAPIPNLQNWDTLIEQSLILLKQSVIICYLYIIIIII